MIETVVFGMDGVCQCRIEYRLALFAAWSASTPDAIHSAISRSGFADDAERRVVSAEERDAG